MSSIASGTGCQFAHLYRVENLVTGSYYIGKHNGLTQNRYWGSGTVWRHHVKKHGTKDLRYTILAIGTPSYILDLERAYVTHAYIDSHPSCMNLMEGGYGHRECFSKETRAKMSQSAKGHTPANKGVPLTPEQRKRVSDSLKGRLAWNKGKGMSAAWRKNLSESHMGQTAWNKGISPTPEVRLKISLTKMGTPPWWKGKRSTCPHCSKSGAVLTMKRWHFDNCKIGGQNVIAV